MRFRYPCPDCRSTNSLHDPDCRFDGTPWPEVERAYTDVLVALADGTKSEGRIREATDGPWDPLHSAALSRLRHEQRLKETRGGALELRSAEEFKEQVSEPTQEPIRTVYEKGSVPGTHDNAVFAMVAYYEMVGLSWAETREQVVAWLHETGTWTRGGFEEASPEQLVDSKRHVYDQGYGWKEKARAAKAIIDRSL
ncbi:DUF7474 family protein [Halomarina oriensis]|uniref:Uncharacterized protein n=1 Tax=Halomarina oriensis TaxID=671145 RepID=A0A6B0GIL0_9EURY|nr:hypothetical protein [Halomarina oriensis]MWG34716.1 hypothetical protein [Halomarina oriensis]